MHFEVFAAIRIIKWNIQFTHQPAAIINFNFITRLKQSTKALKIKTKQINLCTLSELFFSILKSSLLMEREKRRIIGELRTNPTLSIIRKSSLNSDGSARKGLSFLKLTGKSNRTGVMASTLLIPSPFFFLLLFYFEKKFYPPRFWVKNKLGKCHF